MHHMDLAVEETAAHGTAAAAGRTVAETVAPGTVVAAAVHTYCRKVVRHQYLSAADPARAADGTTARSRCLGNPVRTEIRNRSPVVLGLQSLHPRTDARIVEAGLAFTDRVRQGCLAVVRTVHPAAHQAVPSTEEAVAVVVEKLDYSRQNPPPDRRLACREHRRPRLPRRPVPPLSASAAASAAAQLRTAHATTFPQPSIYYSFSHS